MDHQLRPSAIVFYNFSSPMEPRKEIVDAPPTPPAEFLDDLRETGRRLSVKFFATVRLPVIDMLENNLR